MSISIDFESLITNMANSPAANVSDHSKSINLSEIWHERLFGVSKQI